MLVRVAALASVAGFLFGYDLGLIGGAMHGIKRDLGIAADAAVEAIVGAAKLGAALGTFLGGALMLRYGRRRAIALSAAFFAVGPAIMAAANGAGCVLVFMCRAVLCFAGSAAARHHRRPPQQAHKTATPDPQ